MSSLNRPNSGNLDAIRTTDGVVIAANKQGAASTYGVTLTNGVTYVFPLWSSWSPGGTETPYNHISIRWDASIIVTLTIETTSFPAKVTPNDVRGADDLLDWDVTAGTGWCPQNPSTGVYISNSGTGGLTVTNATMAVAGGTAGTTDVHAGNLNSRRARLKAVVGGTGGLLRVAYWGKGAH